MAKYYDFKTCKPRDKYDMNLEAQPKPGPNRRCFDFDAIHIEEDTMIQWATEAEEARRVALYEEEQMDAPLHFYVTPLQGTSAVRMSGQYCNGMRCTGRGAKPQQWHKKFYGKYTWQMSTLGGVGKPTASWLCGMWAHKVQFFYSEYIKAGEPANYEYTDELIDSYAEPDRYTKLANNATHASVLEKVRDIRRERPIQRA